MHRRALPLATAALLLGAVLTATPAPADDWPQWGRDASKNMVSAEKGIPLDFEPGLLSDDDEESIDPKTTKHVRWIAKLGSQTYGNPTVAEGRVYVGTNNESQSDPKYKGDRSLVLCLDEKT
ncbi:MAG: PQQ-binding-like beta-propeller repeat protein, partial [Planctomycetota bacterium]